MVPQPQNPQWPSEYPIMADRVRIFGCSHHQKSLSGQRILRAAPRQIRTLDYCLQNPKWPPGSFKRARRVKTSWGWAGPSSDQLLARYTSIEAWLVVYAVTVVKWFRVFFVYQIKLIKPMWTNQFYQSKFNKANCFRSIQVWKINLIHSRSTNQVGQINFVNVF